MVYEIQILVSTNKILLGSIVLMHFALGFPWTTTVKWIVMGTLTANQAHTTAICTTHSAGEDTPLILQSLQPLTRRILLLFVKYEEKVSLGNSCSWEGSSTGILQPELLWFNVLLFSPARPTESGLTCSDCCLSPGAQWAREDGRDPGNAVHTCTLQTDRQKCAAASDASKLGGWDCFISRSMLVFCFSVLIIQRCFVFGKHLSPVCHGTIPPLPGHHDWSSLNKCSVKQLTLTTHL